MVNKYCLDELGKQIEGTFDLFICSASFEERCLSISRYLDIAKVKKTIIFFTSESKNYIESKKIELEELHGKKADCVEISHSDPLITADKMIEVFMVLSKQLQIKSILIDITTFTHEALLMLLRIHKVVFPEGNITYAYANASSYDPGNEKDNKWLSKGIGQIRSVLGYPGEFSPTQKTYLMVIVGYEYERAASIINSIEPNTLALGFGRSSNATTDKDKDANEHYKNLVEQMSTSYQEIDCFELKCNDPYETCKKIKEKIAAQKDMNIVIVPLNNKITTLGVAFVAIGNSEIQLCYAPALVYNTSSYSEPGEYCYIVDETIPN